MAEQIENAPSPLVERFFTPLEAAALLLANADSFETPRDEGAELKCTALLRRPLR
jgi:hypothetical protein